MSELQQITEELLTLTVKQQELEGKYKRDIRILEEKINTNSRYIDNLQSQIKELTNYKNEVEAKKDKFKTLLEGMVKK